uniref:Protein TAR1 n=1 Tax=Quercus lobata TaxID=97700 RepID=A0A7N2RFC3_QUELO
MYAMCELHFHDTENISFIQLSTHLKSDAMFLFAYLFNITSKVCQPRSRQRRHHGHNYSPGLGRCRNPHRSTPRVDRRTGYRRSTSNRGASPAPIHFPPENFKHSLTLFSSFPRGTCLLSVSHPYLALDRIYRPIGAAFPNNPTRRQRLVVRQGPGTTGLSPSPAPPSRGLGPDPPLRTLLQTTIRRRP